MTISTQTSAISYATNGVTVNFAIPFYWLDDSHLIVEWSASGPLSPLTIDVDYTLAGEGELAGGTLTTLAALAAGTLTIRRLVPLLQLSDFIAGDALAAETVERTYDYLMMAIQQLSDDIASLGSGSPISFANVGASGVSSYSGMSGSTAQFKRIVGASGIVASETATQITLTGSGAGVDLAADYAWTGRHTHTKQAARTTPSMVLKSLQGGADIVDSSILLASDYVAAFDVRKRTDVSIEAPVDASWGGNFGIYVQHAASGTAGANGTLTGGVRAQVETTQVHGAGPVNDCVAFYGGVYNNGTDVGAFGFHLDAYHAGAAGASGHSTYGLSLEMFKNVAGGVAVGNLIRTMGSQPLDYGIMLTRAGNDRFLRGIQFGSPTYANGGVQGSSGARPIFDVGIDLTWGLYGEQAIAVPAGAKVCFSGVAQAQSAVPDKTCQASWSSGTGIWQLDNTGVFKFGVNMTTGNLFGPGTNEMLSLWDTSTAWAISMTSVNKVSNTANGGSQQFGVTATALRAADYAGAIVAKIDGTVVKIPYMSL